MKEVYECWGEEEKKERGNTEVFGFLVIDEVDYLAAHLARKSSVVKSLK